MRTTRARFGVLRLLLAGLLLIAQQTALVHATWHAARGPATEHGQPVAGESGSQSDGGQARLCVFDAVMGHLLGGAACSGTLGGAHTAFDAIVVATAVEWGCVERPSSFRSRAPPPLL